MNNLETLHSDHRALQQHKADVDERYSTAKTALDEALSATRSKWERDNAELINEYTDITLRAASVEGDLRTAIIEAYQANPTTKTVAPGLSVRVNTKLQYDTAKALEWAKAHNLALALDVKAFEAIAKAQPLDFVSIIETPTAVIGK